MSGINIIIMQKDEETGILVREAMNCKVYEGSEYISNMYITEKEGKYLLHIALTLCQEISSWQFDAIYDYYDGSIFDCIADTFSEVEDCFNPTWKITLALPENYDSDNNVYEFEAMLNNILNIHRKEIDDVLEAIKDKKSEYA